MRQKPDLGEPRDTALDGIRGIAILMVFFYHVLGFSNVAGAVIGHGALERAVRALMAEGWAGVDLFFVLSGFLITGILLRTKAGPGYFRNFYFRRTLRIFPLYYLYVLVFFVALPLARPGVATLASDWSRQLWFWGYAENLEAFRLGVWPPTHVHCWSLAIEEQFYLAWPLLVYLMAARRLLGLTIAVMLSQLVLRAALLHQGFGSEVVPLFTPARLDGLMMGAMIATLFHLGREAAELRRLGWKLLALGVALRAALPFSHLPYDYNRQDLQIFAWACLGGGVVLLARALRPTHALRLALSNRVLVFFGRYSYGLYLLHFPIMQAISSYGQVAHGAPALTAFARVAGLSASAAVPAAWVVFKVFEQPILSLRDSGRSALAKAALRVS